MARCLIIGCGCRGLALAARLLLDGHTVRGTTRDRDRAARLEAAGVEAHVGDPDRVGTLSPAFEHATLACVLLGSAVGSADAIEQLHGSRLEMLLARMLDTTIRGIVYETRGTIEARILDAGAQRVTAACEASLIPYVLLDTEPRDHGGWVAAAHDSVRSLLGVEAGGAR